jgi:hypothetical protein
MKSLFENKRAQGMSTSTLVLLILGVVILVVLILGFTLGWSRLAPWLSSNNVDAIKSSCDVACSTGATYEYCSVMRKVNDGVNPKFEDTCFNLAIDENYEGRGYGIVECSQVDCAE